MQQSGSGSAAPKKVRTAVVILCLMLAIRVVNSVVQLPRALRQISEQMGNQGPYGAMAAKIVLFVGLTVGIGMLVLMIVLIYFISKRRNWARITFTVLFAIGLPLVLLGLPRSLSVAPFSAALSLVQFGMQVAALVLLYQRQSSDWFAGRSAPA
jgi:Ni/Fe-hydrogenase subunit HybB-like protein